MEILFSIQNFSFNLERKRRGREKIGRQLNLFLSHSLLEIFFFLGGGAATV